MDQFLLKDIALMRPKSQANRLRYVKPCSIVINRYTANENITDDHCIIIEKHPRMKLLPYNNPPSYSWVKQKLDEVLNLTTYNWSMKDYIIGPRGSDPSNVNLQRHNTWTISRDSYILFLDIKLDIKIEMEHLDSSYYIIIKGPTLRSMVSRATRWPVKYANDGLSIIINGQSSMVPDFVEDCPVVLRYSDFDSLHVLFCKLSGVTVCKKQLAQLHNRYFENIIRRIIECEDHREYSNMLRIGLSQLRLEIIKLQEIDAGSLRGKILLYDSDICTICLGDFVDVKKYSMQCGHVYCSDCVKMIEKCAVCRK